MPIVEDVVQVFQFETTRIAETCWRAWRCGRVNLGISLNFQTLIDSDGIVIAVTGMMIVFVALIMLSLFIKVLPIILDAIAVWVPEVESPHGQTADSIEADGHPAEDDEILAAIGFVLRTRRRG